LHKKEHQNPRTANNFFSPSLTHLFSFDKELDKELTSHRIIDNLSRKKSKAKGRVRVI